MEVHPPEHGIHSWRDFLIHMGTITLGLLIALGLENAAEWVHHRNELHEARERIHEELAENRRTIAEDRVQLQALLERTRTNMETLDAAGPLDSSKLFFGWTWNATSTAAFETARSSGVLALMPYNEAQQYTEIYGQQAAVESAARDFIKDRARLITPLLRHGNLQKGTFNADLTPADRQTLAENCATSLSQIGLVLDLSASMDRQYAGQ